MTFEAIVGKDGGRTCFVDGYPVPEAVYDALYPSKLFPAPEADRDAALAALEKIKASTPPPPPHKGPYFNLAIDDAHPLRSEALAVHPKQIPQAVERNRKHGLSVRYDRHGRPVFTDAGQRRKLMKIEGVRQMESFYGY